MVFSIEPDEADCNTIATSLAALCERGSDVDRHALDTRQARPAHSSPPPKLTSGLAEERINDLMRSYAARIMRRPEESICPDRSLFELGMDSLMAAEFVLMLDRKSGVKLPMDLVTRKLTVDSVSAYVDAKLQPDFRESCLARMTRQRCCCRIRFRNIGREYARRSERSRPPRQRQEANPFARGR